MACRRRHWPPDRATGRATVSPPKRCGNCAIPTRTHCAVANAGWRNRATMSWAGATLTIPAVAPDRQPSGPAVRGRRPGAAVAPGARHRRQAGQRPPAVARMPPASPGPWPRPACVASGLAAGIDGAAHQAALEAGGATVAVLGTGPDVAYPVRHRPLLERIAAEGAVASEHLPGTGRCASISQPQPDPRRPEPGRAGRRGRRALRRAGHRSPAAEAGREVFAPGSDPQPHGPWLPPPAAARARPWWSRQPRCLKHWHRWPPTSPAPCAAALDRWRRESRTGLTHAPPPDGDHHRLWEALGRPNGYG